MINFLICGRGSPVRVLHFERSGLLQNLVINIVGGSDCQSGITGSRPASARDIACAEWCSTVSSRDAFDSSFASVNGAVASIYPFVARANSTGNSAHCCSSHRAYAPSSAAAAVSATRLVSRVSSGSSAPKDSSTDAAVARADAAVREGRHRLPHATPQLGGAEVQVGGAELSGAHGITVPKHGRGRRAKMSLVGLEPTACELKGRTRPSGASSPPGCIRGGRGTGSLGRTSGCRTRCRRSEA